jgi:hypothetical protein
MQSIIFANDDWFCVVYVTNRLLLASEGDDVQRTIREVVRMGEFWWKGVMIYGEWIGLYCIGKNGEE